MAGLDSMSFDAERRVTAEDQSDEQEKQNLGPCRDASTVNAIDLGRSKVPSAAGAVPEATELQPVSAICAKTSHQFPR
jgi:hypothetical protein